MSALDSIRLGVACVLYFFSAVASGAQSPAEAEPYIEPRGHLFVDGKFVSPPYVVESVDNGVSINGHFLKIQAIVPPKPRSRNAWRQSENNGGARARGSRGTYVSYEKRESDDSSEMDEVNAEALAGDLHQQAVVFGFRDSDPIVLRDLRAKADFCEAALTDNPSADLISRLVAFGNGTIDDQHWVQMLSAIKPEGELREWMQGQVNELSRTRTTNERQINAVNRMEFATYPLTVIGMFLGVFALGQNLKWSTSGVSAQHAVGYLKMAVLMILAMSSLDLIWTILSSQAGQMRELNPVAAGLIESPLLLIGFKLAATLTACGILLALRNNPKVQLATWWICLVCVLMTFRWVIFNSMVS